MERHFILPMTIAAALHAGLLFGIHPHAPSAIIRSILPLVQFDPAPLPLETVEPVIPEENVSSPIRSDAKPAPISPEPPPLEHGPGPTIDVPRLERIAPPGHVEKIAFPEAIDGSGDRPGKPSDILASVLLDRPPHARYQAQPIYPFEAKRGSLTGEVVVEFTVDEAGLVSGLRVVRSTDRIFEEATLRAVAKWRFETGTRNGRAVKFRMMVPVVFNLNDS
jgi:periplasmic protein TonB